MSNKQVCSVHLRNQHWYLSNWDNEGMYFTLGLPLPDIDSHNGSTQGRAPHKYKDVPIFAEYHMSSGSKEEDPINKQIRRSPVNLSATVQAISIAPHPIEERTNMSITTAITTQVQSSTIPGGTGPSGGGLSGGGGGGPPAGGGGQPRGGNNNQVTQGDGKPRACYPPYLKEITQKLRVFSENFPPTSSFIMMSQHLPHS